MAHCTRMYVLCIVCNSYAVHEWASEMAGVVLVLMDVVFVLKLRCVIFEAHISMLKFS